MDTYHWDDLVTYHWDVVGCLIWDLSDTSWRLLMGRCCYFLLRCHHDVECFIQDVPATSLGHTEGHSYDVAMTSCCRVDLHITMFVYMFWYIFITLFFEVLPKLTKRLHFWVAWCKFCWFIPEIWCKQRLVSTAQCQ